MTKEQREIVIKSLSKRKYILSEELVENMFVEIIDKELIINELHRTIAMLYVKVLNFKKPQKPMKKMEKKIQLKIAFVKSVLQFVLYYFLVILTLNYTLCSWRYWLGFFTILTSLIVIELSIDIIFKRDNK